MIPKDLKNPANNDEKRPENVDETSDKKTWVDDMKQELEDYIEEQGIYIRQ